MKVMDKANEYSINVLKKKMYDFNYTQQFVADNINVSRSYIRNILDNRHDAHLNIRLINELSKYVFNCSPRDFLPESPL
jgi:transcriptional regulator with XRE-family HTH domain